MNEPQVFTIKRRIKSFDVEQESGAKLKVNQPVKVVEHAHYEEAIREIGELRYLLEDINKRVIPGQIDSIDGLMFILNERDSLRKSLDDARDATSKAREELTREHKKVEAFTAAIEAAKTHIPPSEKKKALEDIYRAFSKTLDGAK